MKTRRVKTRSLSLLISLTLLCIASGAQAAQRELHWDSLDVEAHLNADGVLDVTERHTMVFTGDWNGGERVFNVRPRQKLGFVSLERLDVKTGSPLALRETSTPNNVDEFTWADSRTLRWRSRLPSDPPFANTRLTYVLRYKLGGILLKDDAQYRIDHDFAFPNRPGPIEHFTLNLELDPSWQPIGDFRNLYSAGPIEPGKSFVLNIPLRYSGSGAPVSIGSGRPIEVVVAVVAIVGAFALLALAFVERERAMGRFASVSASGIDSAWIENNILVHPAEVVGAAWDDRIGTSEVVALIARMTAEGKLESKVDGKDSMTMHLKVDRGTLKDHEKALVDGLFFNNRTETSTSEVKKHYKSSGFDPASVISKGLNERVKRVLPAGKKPVGHLVSFALFLVGIVLLGFSAYSEPALGGAAFAVPIVSLILAGVLQIPGLLFRSRMDWGLREAALLLLPALLMCLGTVAFLWFAAGEVELPWTMVAALSAFALLVANASINGLKSRQSREAIAFRKRFTTARSFFLKELQKPQPNLRDSWYPWLLAFGLGRQVDLWSSHHHTETITSSSSWGDNTSPSSSSSSSSSTGANTGWSGGGGLSGGAGASGAWAAAAAGMAAGVAAPSSSSNGGSSSSSSSGGSSGGGGGGGW